MLDFISDMNLQEIAAAFMLEAIPAGMLPRAAASLVEQGNKSESIIELSRLDESTAKEEILFLFETACKEEAINLENNKVAAFILVNYFIREIITGAMDPVTGVSHLLKEVYNRVNHEFHDVKYFGDSLHLEKLFGLYYAMEDIDKDATQEELDTTREEIDEAIKKELLAQAKVYNSKYLYALEEES